MFSLFPNRVCGALMPLAIRPQAAESCQKFTLPVLPAYYAVLRIRQIISITPLNSQQNTCMHTYTTLFYITSPGNSIEILVSCFEYVRNTVQNVLIPHSESQIIANCFISKFSLDLSSAPILCHFRRPRGAMIGPVQYREIPIFSRFPGTGPPETFLQYPAHCIPLRYRVEWDPLKIPARFLTLSKKKSSKTGMILELFK